jgi:hypothetical protein
MRRSIEISSITLCVIIIIIAITLMVLQIDIKSTSGPEGKPGGPGLAEPELSMNLALIPLISVNFLTPGGFTMIQNPRLKMNTTSFILTSIVSLVLVPATTLPLFALSAAFSPSFPTGAIGTIQNILNVTDNHIVLYDRSLTPNVSFLVRVGFTLQPSDRFLVNIFFTT